MICKIAGLFVNALTANDKHFFLNRDNLTKPIQMQLCQKQKTFSHLFSSFLKSGFNFEHFQTNMNLMVYVFQKLQTVNDVVRQLSERSGFGRPFHKEHGK